jgi:hypothetical protein
VSGLLSLEGCANAMFNLQKSVLLEWRSCGVALTEGSGCDKRARCGGSVRQLWVQKAGVFIYRSGWKPGEEIVQLTRWMN